MSDLSSSQTNITFGSNNNLQQAVITLEHVAGRDIIINHDPYDVSLLRDLNPYLGLESFTYANHPTYAGRDPLIAATVAQLTSPGHEQSFLLVTGASGSGKSSLVQAGVLPKLNQHYREQNLVLAWDVFRASVDPIAALSACLRRLGAAIPPGQRTDPASWRGALAAALPPRYVPCIVIDQFEEVFGPQVKAEDREALFEILTTLPAFHEFPLHIIVTMRSDFLPELFAHPTLYAASKQGVDVRAMTPAELQQAIERPVTYMLGQIEQLRPQLAQRLGPKQWEGAVLECLSDDAAQDAAYLPLLQVTIHDMWHKGLLKRTAYTSLTAAIQDRAEEVWHFSDYDGLKQTPRSAEQQQAILALLLDLIDVSLDNDSRRDVRRSSTIDDLIAGYPQREALIDDLVRARLLSKNTRSDGPTLIEHVDIIHESLLRNWQRLIDAIQQARTTLQRRARFRDDLVQWESSGQLLEGIRLAAAVTLAQHGDVVAQSESARSLIASSVAVRDAEQAEKVRQAEMAAEAQRQRAEAESQRAETQTRLNQRTRRFAALLLVLFVFSLISTIFALNRQQVAQEQQRLAVASATKLATQLNVSDSQRLAFAAQNQSERAPELGLLVAYEAVMRDDNSVSSSAFRNALDNIRWLPTTLHEHTSAISSAVFSPNGTRILTASGDGTARVWDSAGQPLMVLSGHSERLNSAVFSPDGQRILTAANDNTARLWDSLGQPVVTLSGHTAEVTSAVFSPDGQRILTASSDHTARLWDSAGKPLAVLAGHSEKLASAVFSPDGQFILTASSDNTARLWDSAGKPLTTLSGHTNDLNSAVFSPDGQRILTASSDQTARLWDRQGLVLATLSSHTQPVKNGIFSPDGRYILTASEDGTSRLWDLDGQVQLVFIGHTDIVYSAVFSPDGAHILTASEDGAARLWDRKGQSLATFTGHTNAVVTASFSPNGQRILTASSDHTARLWDGAGPPLAPLIGHTDDIYSAVFSPDGQRILTASIDKTARLWDRNGQPVATLAGHTDVVRNAVFNADGSRILTASRDGTARLWDGNGNPLTTLTGHTDRIYNATFSPDGSRILTGSRDQTARLWDREGQPLAILSGHADWVYNVAFSPDSQRILTASFDHTARLWDRQGRLLATLGGHTDRIWNATFSPDGQRILTASSDKTARLWDLNGQPLATLTGHSDVVWNAVFSPDGRYILTASEDGTARLWDLNGQPVATLSGHTLAVQNARFSPDGAYILTASEDGTSRLWDGNGQPLTVLAGHSDVVWNAVFSPDSTRILTASADGTARLYVVNLADLLQLATCRVGRGLTADEIAQFQIGTPHFIFAQRQCSPGPGR